MEIVTMGIFTNTVAKSPRLRQRSRFVVVVYHVTIVAIGHGLLEEILAIGTRLRSTHWREFNYLKLCRPAYFVRTTQLLPHPGHE